MTIYEVLSIISTVLTALIAIGAIIAPFVFSYLTNKSKLRARELKMFHEAINGMMEAYGDYRNNAHIKSRMLSSIYLTMTYCSDKTKKKLQILAEKIASSPNSYADSDAAFYECISSLQKEFDLIKLLRKPRRLLK